MRYFSNWLKAYMVYTSDSESPDAFHFWSGVSTIAGALRRRVWIDMRKFQWTPNFYIVLVGPPGVVTKSTSIRAGMRLLEQIQGIHFGPPSLTWQALADSLSTAIEHMRLVTNGVEKFHPMSCITIPISELGTFLKIDDSALVDVLVDLWDGQLTAWAHKTRTSGQVDIRNPWLNIIGCTTPAWLKEHFPEHLIGGGLTSRVVFVYGDTKRKLVAYPDEVIQDAAYLDMEQKLLHDLIEISTMQGSFTIDAAGRAWGKDWYARHWTGGGNTTVSGDRYSGYIARKQTHIHKLAIICAAARSNALTITDTHLKEAEALLNVVEPHMKRVFESVGLVDEARHSHELMAFVRTNGWMTTDALWRLVMNVMNQREYEEALRAAIRGGLLIVEKQNGKMGVNAPGLNTPASSAAS